MVDLSPTFLNTGTTDETLLPAEKQDFFKHIPKDLASMYKSLDSHFFRTTTSTQSGKQIFDKSRLIMTFLTNLSAILTLFCFQISSTRKIR